MDIDTVATGRSRAARARGALSTVGCAVVTVVALGFLLPTLFGLQRYVIAGGSMTGTIDLGSVVFDRVVPTAQLRVGDIITYQPPASAGIDHLVTHRIVTIRPGAHGSTYRTKGDANPQADPWDFQLTAGTQARVAFSVPYVGYPVLALADRATRVAAIGIPAGVIALLSLLELVRTFRRPTLVDA